MSKPQSNLDELMKNPKAASLLQNKDFIQQILRSPDAKRLMELLNQSAGEGLKSAADAAVKGDPSQLTGLINQVMQSREGAQVVERIQNTVPKK